jgi:DNA polymerase delta subunit 4
MKDFYRQKKKGGVTKASSSSKKKTQHYTGGASVGASDAAQTSALVSHGYWDLKGTCPNVEGFIICFNFCTSHFPTETFS